MVVLIHYSDYTQHVSVMLITNLPFTYSVTQAVTSLLTRTVAYKMKDLTLKQLPVMVVLTWTRFGWELLAVIKSKLMQVVIAKSL